MTRAPLFALVALLSTSARAQTLDQLAGQGAGSLDLERLRPGLDKRAILDVESGETGRAGEIDAALWLSGLDDPLTITLKQGTSSETVPVVQYRLGADVVASYAFTRSFELGLEIPTVLYQAGPSFLAGVAGKNPVAVAGLDDVRVVPKLGLLRMDTGAPVDLSVAAHVTLPTSVPRHQYIGDGLPTVTPELDASTHFGDLRLAADGGLLVRAPSTFGNAVQGEELAVRVGAAYRLGPVDVEASINQSLLLFPQPLSAHNNPGEVLAGLSAPLGALEIFGAVGTSVVGGPSTPLVRALAGVRYAPAACDDPDGDGVCGSDDKCPNDPEDRDGFEDQDGCPDLDNDKDGIADAVDACPNEPGPASAHGCPDADGDGVPDKDDACVAVAGRADHKGCPYTLAEDRDRDGIPNWLDKCPDQPEDFDGVRDDDGCPGDDEDGDGVPDAVDKCPNDPETYNGVDDGDGCPDAGRVKAEIVDDKIVITPKLVFAEGSVALDTDESLMLDAVAALLKAHTEIKHVRFGVHTEPTIAKRAKDLKLSQSRATTIKTYLVKKGVEGDRVQAVGYGGSLPIDNAGNAAAVDNNRRVDIVILEREPRQ